MIYYEKKYDKIEDLKYFGFSSNKDVNTPTTNIALYDDKDNEIEYIDVGWYNIDLGRGTKASYIKLKNQFQVWKAEVDFYDLSLDYKGWTYSSLWNLRFGRLKKYNNIDDNDKVINVVKNLLNIFVINVVDFIDATNLGYISIVTENDDDIKLSFYKTNDNKYFVRYDFINNITNNHLFEYYTSVNGKYLEITESDWEKIKNDTTK